MRPSLLLPIIVASVAAAPLPQFDLGALLGGGAGGAPGGGSGGGKVMPYFCSLKTYSFLFQVLDLFLGV
jgi:hypothetical protein